MSLSVSRGIDHLKAIDTPLNDIAFLQRPINVIHDVVDTFGIESRQMQVPRSSNICSSTGNPAPVLSDKFIDSPDVVAMTVGEHDTDDVQVLRPLLEEARLVARVDNNRPAFIR
jgi:hypothetical protein